MGKSKKADIIAILIKIEDYLHKYLSEKWLKILFFPVFILYILLITTPSPLWVQFLSFLVIFFLTLIFIKNRKESIKVFIILTGVFVSLRYFYWRTFNTLNLDDGIFNAIASIILYLAELYSMIILILGSFMSLRLLERNHINLEKKEDFLTVDVFIPTYNEPVEIVKTTALAAISMDYPQDKFNVYILDDGGTTQKLNDPDPAKREENRQRSQALKDFVNEVGGNLHYITRERNLHAKAGNINEALKKTNGDLILILDCDHVPAKDFLKRTVGFFNKYPKLFLVQTPHSFYNPDPLEKKLRNF
ncbi:glycosyltransferase [Sulfurihydrogenibium sp.]|jgi:cellulose synthase (UDP-forming)|uniref:glycosyltransferase n=1 Tax=Sulfurihydrogenibium sp. TaxID=2053621 RepID=UPI002631EE21|nr:glycosyltransferase [Sulfurihydrogenibium sp.]